jgi:hypothetical protein
VKKKIGGPIATGEGLAAPEAEIEKRNSKNLGFKKNEQVTCSDTM